eukprot:186783-Pyramimonas_sp.AAC.1
MSQRPARARRWSTLVAAAKGDSGPPWPTPRLPAHTRPLWGTAGTPQTPARQRTEGQPDCVGTLAAGRQPGLSCAPSKPSSSASSASQAPRRAGRRGRTRRPGAPVLRARLRQLRCVPGEGLQRVRERSGAQVAARLVSSVRPGGPDGRSAPRGRPLGPLAAELAR